MITLSTLSIPDNFPVFSTWINNDLLMVCMRTLYAAGNTEHTKWKEYWNNSFNTAQHQPQGDSHYNWSHPF